MLEWNAVSWNTIISAIGVIGKDKQNKGRGIPSQVLSGLRKLVREKETEAKRHRSVANNAAASSGGAGRNPEGSSGAGDPDVRGRL
jgi:hypothetical protein